MVHNKYGALSGEDVVVTNIVKLLRARGHEVYCFFRNSEEILGSFWLKTKAFFSGIYSFAPKKAIRRMLAEQKPDLVHVNNLFPLISPSVLSDCHRAGLPVVMTVHNYRLICPNGLFMTNGKTCEKCSGGREYWCVLRNCEKSLFKSVGYALRNYVARRRRFYINNVTVYTALTQFQRQRLIQEGYSSDRICVVPNMADVSEMKVSVELGKYVSYIGRVSPEKGISTFIEAARLCRDIKFKIAGLNVRMPDLSKEALSNLEFCGHLKAGQLDKFYRKSRIIILPSICYETFGLTLAEAALWGKPVICSRIGGLPEIVEDGVTGLLFQPDNAHDLQAKVRYLWERPELCKKMGQAGREKALCEYSAPKYYNNLMATYEKAIQLVKAHHRPKRSTINTLGGNAKNGKHKGNDIKPAKYTRNRPK